MNTAKSEPDVLHYSNYRAFLLDYYEYKKEEQPIFSHRYFAQKAGITSPNYLKLVMDGSAPDKLLDSYDSERTLAADENIRSSTRATDFITPKSAVSRAFRDATPGSGRRDRKGFPRRASGLLPGARSVCARSLSAAAYPLESWRQQQR